MDVPFEVDAKSVSFDSDNSDALWILLAVFEFVTRLESTLLLFRSVFFGKFFVSKLCHFNRIAFGLSIGLIIFMHEYFDYVLNISSV